MRIFNFITLVLVFIVSMILCENAIASAAVFASDDLYKVFKPERGSSYSFDSGLFKMGVDNTIKLQNEVPIRHGIDTLKNCFDIDENGSFSNNCSFPISASFCFDSDALPACKRGEISTIFLSPSSPPVRIGNTYVETLRPGGWSACKFPLVPHNVKYNGSKQLSGSCAQMSKSSSVMGSVSRSPDIENSTNNNIHKEVASTTNKVDSSSKAQQQAQQQAQESQQLAQQNQSRADQERQGQRKTNNPAAQAHQCIEVDKDSALFGGFKNSCEYKVNYVFCNFGPKKNSWADFHNCERKHGIGAWHAGAGRTSAAHTKNTAMVYWFACKDPSWPVDSVFVLGKGIEARCR